MNKLMKRVGSGLLALMLVLTLVFAGLPVETFAASTTYNTGTRHDYSAVLSDQALDYYTGSYTWEKLSALEGGTENCLDMDNPMFEALNTLMTDTMTNSVSYSSLPDYWKYTDASGGSSGTIWFYWDTTSSGTMSREHVWPKSHASFHEKDGGCDLHHLRPSISNINSSRGNLIMGNVQGLSGAKTYSYNGDEVLYRTSELCEVNDNIKGDVARIFLYVWCRWEEPNLFKDTSNPVIGPNDSANDGGKVIESLDTLLQWCEMDPVDTWEMSRNDKVEDIQGNRNVFIDYPEFAWLIFGRDVPAGYNTPSDNGGSASGGTGSTTCTHNWVAATCTTPKTCSKCSATEGTALGHTWSAATCVAPKTCSVCKATEGSVTAHTDSNSDNACDVCGTSMGTVIPPVTGNGYYLISSADQFTSGQYVMIADKGYAPGVYENGWLTAIQPTVDGNQVTDAAGGIWTLTVNGTSVTLTDANGVTVKPKSGNSNGIQSGAYDWAWAFNASEGTFTFKGTGSDTTTLASNTTSGNKFRAYKNSTVSGGNYPYNFKLYKLVEAAHEHSYTETVTTAPTCTEEGVKTYTCECGESYTEVIAALGHSYNAVVTDPTCVAAGYTTYTCSTCGDSYKDNETAATGHAYDNDQDADCNNCGEIREVGPATDANLKFNAAPGLSFKDYIGMQILVTSAVAQNYDSVWIEAVQADPAGDVTTTLEGVSYFYNIYLKFEQQVLSWSMAENITLTLYAEKDGVTVKGETFSGSVEDLALAKIAEYAAANNTAAVTALVDMLNYGAAVQTSFNHNADMLPNTKLGDYTGTIATPEFNATNSITGTGSLTVASNSISMQAKVEIQLLIMGKIDGYTVSAKVGGADAPVVVDTEKYAGYGWTLVKVAVAADKMREVYNISVNDANGTPVTPVYNVSVEAYGKTQLEGAKADVVIAMMRYGDSVAAL